MRIIAVIVLLALLGNRASGQEKAHYLIPTPEMVEMEDGVFILDRLVVKGIPRSFAPFQEWLKATTPVKVSAGKRGAHNRSKELRYTLNPALALEGYTLHISPLRIEIEAASEAGFLYAEQTLIQLAEQNDHHALPCMFVRDQPRFVWRGMHLDESRHFMGKAFVKKYIDWLFALKMNVFHWHLTDAQGWRIEIKKYPRLTSIGAWRPDRTGILNSDADTARMGEPMTYGGFYTQEDVREIVAYAAKRQVTIVPEIEMPGHTTAALVAYPEFSCTGGPFPIPGGAKNCPYPNYCVGNEQTYTFLENVLSEVIELFPSSYIHIGGDEVPREQWKSCTRCQERRMALGLADESQLQVYFTKRIEAFLLQKGRRLMGWDEIMEGGNLTPSAGVMVWRGEHLARDATAAGHEVIIAHHYYFDLYQGSPGFEPVTYGYLPLEGVFQYEPIPSDFSPEQRKKVLGVEGCLWTENIYDTHQAEYMLFPRILALSDVAWSQPERRHWDDFKHNLPGMLEWLDKRHTHYATSVFDPTIQMETDTLSKRLQCRFEQQISFGDIHYSLDGSAPTRQSSVFKQPFLLAKPGEIRATAFLPHNRQSKTLSMSYNPSLASGKLFTLGAPPDNQYNGKNTTALTDGLQGSEAFHDGRWCGFYGVDFDMIIDLGSPQALTAVQLHWLEAENSWIYLPPEMWVETSMDGHLWTPRIVRSKADVVAASANRIKPIVIALKGLDARYVRVFARNQGQHPLYADGKCWLFIDELRVD